VIIAEFCRPEPSQASDDHPERVRRDDTARPPRSVHAARRPVHTTPRTPVRLATFVRPPAGHLPRGQPGRGCPRGTALTWAAFTGAAAAAARRLLELGAHPDQRGTFGGPQHGRGVTALHLAAHDRRLEALGVLLDGGADPAIRDELYDSTPAGWADHDNQPAAAALLRAAHRG